MSDMPEQPKYTEKDLDDKIQQLLKGRKLQELISEELGMENRMDVLLLTLRIEHLLGEFIVKLGLQGEKKGFMSFDTKIKKLAENVIDKDEQTTLDTFRWTRNRFIHELDITNFVKCYEEETEYKKLVMDLAEEEIRRTPNDWKWTEEMKLHMGFNLLAQKVSTITRRLTDDLIHPISSSPSGPQDDKPA